MWLIYAYSHEDGEILAFSMGKRNKKTFKHLLLKLKGISIEYYLTDAWKVFKENLPSEKHLIGKQFTKAIEGINTFFRTRLRRLTRRTTGFSKKLENHYNSIKLLVFLRNTYKSYIL